MKNNLLFLFLLLISSTSFSQTDTIRIRKLETVVYRCGNPTAKDWYIYKSEETFFLANVHLPESEVQLWFERYINSQNLLQSKIILRQGKDFFQFEQPNNPESRLYFEIIRMSDLEILTQSLETGEEFYFTGIEF